MIFPIDEKKLTSFKNRFLSWDPLRHFPSWGKCRGKDKLFPSYKATTNEMKVIRPEGWHWGGIGEGLGRDVRKQHWLEQNPTKGKCYNRYSRYRVYYFSIRCLNTYWTVLGHYWGAGKWATKPNLHWNDFIFCSVKVYIGAFTFFKNLSLPHDHRYPWPWVQ